MLRPTSAGSSGSRPTSAGGGGGMGSSVGMSGTGLAGSGLSTTHIPVGLQFTVSSILTDTVGLLLQPPSGVTLNAILRLPAHCAMRAHISMTEWLNAAPTAMGLSEEVAVRLFEAFSLLWQHQGQRFERRIEATRALLQAMAGNSSNTSSSNTNNNNNAPGKSLNYASVTAQRAVSLPGFMIFLAAQTFLERAALNGIAPSGGSASGNSTPTRGGAAGGANPQIVPPETYAEPFLAFVRENLSSLMSFLCMGTPGRICVADLVELRILFREWDNGAESPFSTKLQFLWSSSGVPGGVSPPAAASIESQVLIQLLRSRLCLLSELRGSGQGPASSLLLYRGVAHQTIHSQTGIPRCSEMHHCVRLQRCTQSTFFVLHPLPSVVISRCTNCIIFLGPVAGVLVVDRCEHCQIVALCAGVVVQGGRNVTLFIGANTPPIIVPPNSSVSPTGTLTDDGVSSEMSNGSSLAPGGGGGASGTVYLAPYNTCFASLEDHCLQARVNPKLNLFSEKNRNSAQWVATTQSSMQASSASAFVALLPPSQFCSLVVPPPIAGTAATATATGGGQQHQQSVSTRANPVSMPAEYANALQERVTRCQDVSSQLLNAYRTLETNNRQDLAEELRKKVQGAFVEWLEQTGQVQGLADLLSIGQGAAAGGGAGGSGGAGSGGASSSVGSGSVGRAATASVGGRR